jgi:hypothetical protein
MEGASFPIAKGIRGRGELKIKNSIPNPTASAHLAHFFSTQSRIGEAFGFKVTSLFGRRPRSQRVGRGQSSKAFILSI